MRLTHSGVDVAHYTSMHVLGSIFPLSAGLLLYGWRALGTILIVCASTAFTLALWRRVGRRGKHLRYDHALWLALLLSLTLPPHLLNGRDVSSFSNLVPWPILPAAGMTLAILLWLLGAAGSGRVHAVLVTNLLMVVLFRDLLAHEPFSRRRAERHRPAARVRRAARIGGRRPDPRQSPAVDPPADRRAARRALCRARVAAPRVLHDGH
jgi:hypothetical protein